MVSVLSQELAQRGDMSEEIGHVDLDRSVGQPSDGVLLHGILDIGQQFLHCRTCKQTDNLNPTCVSA